MNKLLIFITMAWRNIWRNTSRSLVILFSVAVGLLTGIIVIALYKGMMDSRVRTVIHTETGHMQIHAPGFTSDLDPASSIVAKDSIINMLKNDKHIDAYATRVKASGMLANPSGSSGVVINGVDAYAENKVSKLTSKIMRGDTLWDRQVRSLLVGKKLADKMKLDTGMKIVLTTIDTSNGLISSAFRIRAIYKSSNTPLDEVNVYIKKEDLQEMLAIGNGIHEIAVLLQEDSLLASTLQNYHNIFPSYTIESWRDISPETDLLVKTFDVYSYILLVIIFVALSFGIMNTMMMAILERRQEIGMMMALGMSSAELLVMILFESLFLTSAGIPVALIIGIPLVGYYHEHGLDLSGAGKELMGSFGFETRIYPDFPSDNIFNIILLVLTIGLLSSILPIWRGIKMNPVEALQK